MIMKKKTNNNNKCIPINSMYKESVYLYVLQNAMYHKVFMSPIKCQPYPQVNNRLLIITTERKKYN